MSSEYCEIAEGLRVVDTGGSKYKIILDRTYGFWHIEVDTGSVPVDLRGQYTSHKYALEAIKNYLHGKPERQIVYKKPKVA